MPDELLSVKLRSGTLANHQQLEKMLVGRLKAMRTTHDYTGILQHFYSYFNALERRIVNYIGPDELPDIQLRRKSGNLLLDLQALNGTIPPSAEARFMPEINGVAAAFGGLYVMEGSTLGGQVIATMVKKQLGFEKGLVFFTGYGEQTLPMWAKFKTVIDALPDHAAVVKSANATFAGFASYLSDTAAH